MDVNKMKKYYAPTSPVHLSWSAIAFISIFLYDAEMLLGVPLIRVFAEGANSQVRYLWHMVFQECKGCGVAVPNDPSFPLQMKRDENQGVYYWECPACTMKHYPHFIEAFVESFEYGTLKMARVEYTNDEMMKKIIEAWNMAIAYVSSQYAAYAEIGDLVKRDK